MPDGAAKDAAKKRVAEDRENAKADRDIQKEERDLKKQPDSPEKAKKQREIDNKKTAQKIKKNKTGTSKKSNKKGKKGKGMPKGGAKGSWDIGDYSAEKPDDPVWGWEKQWGTDDVFARMEAALDYGFEMDMSNMETATMEAKFFAGGTAFLEAFGFKWALLCLLVCFMVLIM